MYWSMLLSKSQLLFLALCISPQFHSRKVERYKYTACDGNVTSKYTHLHVNTSMFMHYLVGTNYSQCAMIARISFYSNIIMDITTNMESTCTCILYCVSPRARPCLYNMCIHNIHSWFLLPVHGYIGIPLQVDICSSLLQFILLLLLE